MSKTYATIQGTRGPATRCGGNDGVRASAQSYDGSVIVENWYNDDKLMVRLGTNDGSSCCSSWANAEFTGTFEDIKNLIQLANDIKSGKVSVVHHRAKKN